MKPKKFLFASSEGCADLLYATGFRAPDPFACLIVDDTPCLLLNDLEIDRARAQLPALEVRSISELENKIRGRKRKKPPLPRVLATFLKERRAKRVCVPTNFPLGLARALKKEGIRVRVAKGELFAERRIKGEEELRALRAAARIAEAGMARGFEVLAASTIRRDGRLFWAKKVLTSEILRGEMEVAVLRHGGEARMDTIAACGEQACDPHGRGTGPLRAHSLIILDIFPRDARTGYYGDITRTVVRGKASDPMRHLWETCLEGQRRALKSIRPGLPGASLQDAIKEFFAESGYPTEVHEGRWRGFFHGLGHGLGLEIHEEPRVAATDFQPGEVLTVEPGIYWPGVGGVRHEDTIVVVEDGIRQLSRHPKPLEI